MVFVMIVIGLNQGLQPIIGYNFGAKKVDRVASAVRYGVLCAVSVTTVGFILGQTLPHALAAMFTTDAVLTDLAVRGMHIALLVFPIVGLQMVTAAFFQSIGKVNKAILLSLTRQMLFLVPLLAILPRFLGTDGVWLSMPVADTASTILAVFLLRRQIRQFREEDKKANIKTDTLMETKDQKFVICLGREYGSGGHNIGKALSKMLGIEYYDKKLLDEAAKNSGISQEYFARSDEKAPGSFSHTLSSGLFAAGGIFMYSNSLSSENIFKYQSEAIREIASRTSCIIVGRCADYVLREQENVFSVFITARWSSVPSG